MIFEIVWEPCSKATFSQLKKQRFGLPGIYD